MLYCVHCGVSLAEDITICPLCGNAATEQGSERPAALASSALFDEEPAGIPTDLRYHRVFLGWGLSLLLLAAGIISYGIDLSRDQQITWSYYVMISLVTVWTITVLPLFHRRWSTTHLLAFTAAILGLFLIFIDARTGDLFWSLFPCSLLIALALSLLILHDRRDRPLRVTLLLLYGAFILLQSITAWLTDGNWFYSLGLPITSTVWLLISAFIFVVKTRSASQQPPRKISLHPPDLPEHLYHGSGDRALHSTAPHAGAAPELVCLCHDRDFTARSGGPGCSPHQTGTAFHTEEVSHMTRQKKSYWTKLDNAALIFPVTINAWGSSFFRISAMLDDPVDHIQLQQALDRCISRFPYFHVKLRQGAFWMFLEDSDRRPLVDQDRYYPCLTVKTPKQRELLFRVLYLENRVSLEMSHVLTDGFGAVVFLKNILAEYLRLQGVSIEPDSEFDLFDLDQIPEEEETVDAFHRFYDHRAPKDKTLPVAYQMRIKNSPPGVDHVITGIVPTAAILEKTREHQVSITEYLVSIILYALQSIQQEDPKENSPRPLRLNVPANLRKFYGIRTMKNFSLYTTPEIDPKLGEFTFEEVLEQVHHYMRKHNTEKYIKQQITRNVGGETNPFIRVIPFPIKQAFLRSMHAKYGEKQQSICLSNLGRIALPQSMLAHVTRFDFIPAGSMLTKTMLAVTGFNDSLYLSFGRVAEEPLLERRFFAFLQQQGIPCVLESNNTPTSSSRPGFLKRRGTS